MMLLLSVVDFSAAGGKRLPVYQVFDGSLVLVDLPQSLIIALHLVDKLSQVLSNKSHNKHTHTHWLGLLQSGARSQNKFICKELKNEKRCVEGIVCPSLETNLSSLSSC